MATLMIAGALMMMAWWLKMVETAALALATLVERVLKRVLEMLMAVAVLLAVPLEAQIAAVAR